MNETEIERLAAAANALRPDWPIGSLKSLLAKPELCNRPRRDVAVALAWVACESETKTPARVLQAGPWWKAATVEEQASAAYRRVHWLDLCSVCNYAEDGCRRAFAEDHDFLSNGEKESKRAPAHREPRLRLRGPWDPEMEFPTPPVETIQQVRDRLAQVRAEQQAEESK